MNLSGHVAIITLHNAYVANTKKTHSVQTETELFSFFSPGVVYISKTEVVGTLLCATVTISVDLFVQRSRSIAQ